jgi:hypothetical protein
MCWVELHGMHLWQVAAVAAMTPELSVAQTRARKHTNSFQVNESCEGIDELCFSGNSLHTAAPRTTVMFKVLTARSTSPWQHASGIT